MKSILTAVCACFVVQLSSQAQTLDSSTKIKIEEAVHSVMQQTGVPSAQIGIIRDGKIVYTVAFGDARLADATSPALAATPQMHYAIGSISKQFTATCILLLQERGKLKLDDPVARWFPELNRSRDVTVRNLLTHTSGYSDYAPQDYTIPAWTKATTPEAIVHEWAEKPLDFDPGTRWQYSNTNFVLAGLIIEKASGEPFIEFLRQNVLNPLGLRNILDLSTDRDRLEPQGYMRNALGPLRPAILEAPGWYFADGSLAMPVATLLQWDLSLINRSLLKPESYKALETEMLLKDGSNTRYGLGVSVSKRNGRALIAHSGEVGGFVASNAVLPEDKIGVAVLTNQEASSAASQISHNILDILLPQSSGAATASPEAQARKILESFAQNQIDRMLFTPDANFYFSQQTINDFASSLKSLGAVRSIDKRSESLRGGMTFRSFHVTFASGKELTLTTFNTPDGLYEQFLIGP
jgi:CubicO group peptidase (beta-lactamase class C family)